MSTGPALAAIAVIGAFGLFAWRWSIPYQQSIYKTVTGRSPEPGSVRYRLLQVGRAIVIAACIYAIALIIGDWTGVLSG
jgi:hypothetical protein